MNIEEEREYIESKGGVTTIECLPSEIISIILQNVESSDALNFGATCKLFYEMVKSDQCLWKERFKKINPPESFELIVKRGVGDWYIETQWLTTIKKHVFEQILAMSPKFYCGPSEVTLEDMRSIFALALSNNISYYFVIRTIQEIVRNAKINVDKMHSEKPYTLTEMYYGRVASRHLLHTFLALKWVKMHIKGELSPKIVLNFFVQWVDTDYYYSDEAVEEKINELVAKVEKLLDDPFQGGHSNRYTVRERCEKGLISTKKVIVATSYLLYQEMRITMSASCNVDTLNIIKVINNRCGHTIAVATIYLSIVKAFGVQCELLAFPNHLILNCHDFDEQEPCPRGYTADLTNGTWYPKRQCPFSYSSSQTYKYSPDSFIQYIYTAFHGTMRAFKNWQTQNALHLLDFLSTFDNEQNPYRNFLPYLLDRAHLPAMDIPLELKYLHDSHLNLIGELASLNKTQRAVPGNIAEKKRFSNIKYAVGMICSHKKYDYTCIIRGWDPMCTLPWHRKIGLMSLGEGFNQPFYQVIAADQSERYVAQENLVEVVSPNRLHHLEDFISREFTHFDGFSYVPNDEKKSEYPYDMPVVSMYRQRCEMRRNRVT